MGTWAEAPYLSDSRKLFTGAPRRPPAPPLWRTLEGGGAEAAAGFTPGMCVGDICLLMGHLRPLRQGGAQPVHSLSPNTPLHKP